VVLLVVQTTGNKRRVVRAKVSKVLLQGNLPQVAIRERAKCLGNGNSPRITDHGLQKPKWVKAAGRATLRLTASTTKGIYLIVRRLRAALKLGECRHVTQDEI